MPHWTYEKTLALRNAETSLKVVDQLLSFVKVGPGKPAGRDKAIFAAAAVFLYGIWENYVEQLSMEAAERTASTLQPSKVPDVVRKALEKSTAWELSVHPGWKQLWVNAVKTRAVGDDEKFGMNTARSGQVKALLALAGANDVFAGAAAALVAVPAHLGAITAEEAVNKLVDLHGEIVHTGKVPATMFKQHAHDWNAFVKAICTHVDDKARDQCRALIV